MKKFTFKKQPRETGLAGVANPTPATDVKLSGVVVGAISPPHWSDKDRRFSVSLRTVEPESRAGWAWTKFKARFDTEPEARAWLLRNQATIEAKYTLHVGE